MVDNYELLLEFLQFESDDDFYQLQIIKRRKENPTLGNNFKVVKDYFINSIELLETQYPDIVAICEATNSRAYLNLNKRSFKRAALLTIKKMVDQLDNHDYKNAGLAYRKTITSFSSQKPRRWVLDLDREKEELDEDFERRVAGTVEVVLNLQALTKDPSYAKVIPTLNGTHIICGGFNCEKFERVMAVPSQVVIMKNSPTILYSPSFLEIG